MLLIDDIVEVTDHRAVCRTTLHPNCVFAIDGVVHPSALIELVAQVCAIHAGVVSVRGGGPPRLGLITACREIAFAVDQLAVGDELTIVANKLFAQDRMATFTGTVTRGDAVCATVQLSVVDAALAAMQVGSGDAP